MPPLHDSDVTVT